MPRNKFTLSIATLAVAAAILLVGLSFDRRVSAQATVNAPPANAPSMVSDEQNTIDIVRTFGPSVVAINVEVRGQRVNPMQGLPGPFGQMVPQMPSQPRLEQGSGSGFVVDNAGQIITNFHVVADALQSGTVDLKEGAKLSVVFSGSDEELAARVVGANPDYDLALVELVDASRLPKTVTPIPLADTDAIQVGQKVIAIGNPFGLQSSVSQGIVSAVGRELPSIGRVKISMVQTDAAINPGNSGGPLLDSSGRLIGINTMIVPGMSSNGQAGNIGIGFAVPANLLNETLADLRDGGLIGVYAQALDIENKPRIGVQVLGLDEFPKSVRETLNMPESGVVVMGVATGGPADKAGLVGPNFEANIGGSSYPAGGDIIVKVDGKDVESATAIQAVVLSKAAGDKLALEVWRNGETRSVEVTLEVVAQPEANSGADN